LQWANIKKSEGEQESLTLADKIAGDQAALQTLVNSGAIEKLNKLQQDKKDNSTQATKSSQYQKSKLKRKP
jgi:Ni,Fe-hydrogenase III large subunit